MRKRKLLFALFFYTVSTAIVAFWLIPFIITVFTSTKGLDEIMTSREIWRPPLAMETSAFRTAWVEGHMRTYFRNTFLIATPSVLGCMFVASLSAFALAFYRFRFSRAVLMLFVGGMLIPFQMLLIPVYRLSTHFGLYNTLAGVILFHVGFQIGFCTFFLRNFMVTIPYSLFESARMDGASHLAIYRKIVLPLSLPAMAALAILEFTWIWNDYLWGLVLLQSDHLKTVTLGLANMQGQYVTQYNVMAAGSLLAAAIPIGVFLIFNRFFIEGLTVGAVKG
jgi:multiple sugar transport system permease protein